MKPSTALQMRRLQMRRCPPIHRFLTWRLFLRALLFISVFTFTASAQETKIGIAKLQALIAQGVPVVDIRRPDEWRHTGVMPGAHLITFFDAKGRYDLQGWVAKLSVVVDKGEPLVLICHSGPRSGAVSRILGSKFGYASVFDATDGMAGWIKHGLPMDSSHDCSRHPEGLTGDVHRQQDPNGKINPQGRPGVLASSRSVIVVGSAEIPQRLADM